MFPFKGTIAKLPVQIYARVHLSDAFSQSGITIHPRWRCLSDPFPEEWTQERASLWMYLVWHTMWKKWIWSDMGKEKQMVTKKLPNYFRNQDLFGYFWSLITPVHISVILWLTIITPVHIHDHCMEKSSVNFLLNISFLHACSMITQRLRLILVMFFFYKKTLDGHYN